MWKTIALGAAFLAAGYGIAALYSPDQLATNVKQIAGIAPEEPEADPAPSSATADGEEPAAGATAPSAGAAAAALPTLTEKHLQITASNQAPVALRVGSTLSTDSADKTARIVEKINALTGTEVTMVRSRLVGQEDTILVLVGEFPENDNAVERIRKRLERAGVMPMSTVFLPPCAQAPVTVDDEGFACTASQPAPES